MEQKNRKYFTCSRQTQNHSLSRSTRNGKRQTAKVEYLPFVGKENVMLNLSIAAIGVILIGVTVTTNVNKPAAMIRACNTGGAYNILRDIACNFNVHYFIHGSKSRNFASQF